MNVAYFSLAALVAGTLACGEIVPQNQGGPAPAPAPTASAGDAGPDDAGPGTPPKRTVETRNPYGNLDGQNLVLDGDFEFSGRQGQMPWLSFNGGQGTLNYETGGLCFSGVRCARLVKGDALFGWMVSPKAGVKIEVTLKVRTLVGSPQDGGVESACAEPAINVYLIDIDNQNNIERIRIDENAPPVNGYCTYRSIVDSIPNASPGFYVESISTSNKDVILMDQVIAKPVAANTAFSRSNVRPEPITAASKAGVTAMIEWVRTHRKNVGERAAQPLK